MRLSPSRTPRRRNGRRRRWLQDYPAHIDGVTVDLAVCRWRCLAPACSRRIFGPERLECASFCAVHLACREDCQPSRACGRRAACRAALAPCGPWDHRRHGAQTVEEACSKHCRAADGHRDRDWSWREWQTQIILDLAAASASSSAVFAIRPVWGRLRRLKYQISCR